MAVSPPSDRSLIVVMGPSGCGKSTLGVALADRLDATFLDADALHPASNRAKMTAGIPLTDADRMPWLEAAGQALGRSRGSGGVLACSALRKRYRDVIRRAVGDVVFVELAGDRDLLRHRVASRAGHFMPAALVDSQLEVLEPLAEDESGVRVDARADADRNVTVVVDWLRERRAQSPLEPRE